MNQEKIGSFIAQCRKEKNLTQAQLAEKLNMSNKTISKWETGKGMPDSSIMLELCSYLGISVNELLSGERLSNEEYEKKTNQNLIAITKENEKQKKKNKKIIVIFLFTILFTILILVGIHIYNTHEISIDFDERLIKCEIIEDDIIYKFEGSSLINFTHKEINTDNETLVFFTGNMLLQNKIHSHFETWDSMAQLSNENHARFETIATININNDIIDCKPRIKVYYTENPLNRINDANLETIIEKSYLMCEK